MADEEKDVMKFWPVMLIASVVGGGSGLGALQMSNPRPDPWTGTDAKTSHQTMERQWTTRHDRLEHRLDELQIRMDKRFDQLQNIILDRHR